MATLTKPTVTVGPLQSNSDRSTHAVSFGQEYAEVETPIGTVAVFATSRDRVIVATHGYANYGYDWPGDYVTVRGIEYLLHTGVTRTTDGDTEPEQGHWKTLSTRATSAPWTVYTDCGLSRRDGKDTTKAAWAAVVESAAAAADAFATAYPLHMHDAEVRYLTTKASVATARQTDAEAAAATARAEAASALSAVANAIAARAAAQAGRS